MYGIRSIWSNRRKPMRITGKVGRMGCYIVLVDEVNGWKIYIYIYIYKVGGEDDIYIYIYIYIYVKWDGVDDTWSLTNILLLFIVARGSCYYCLNRRSRWGWWSILGYNESTKSMRVISLVCINIVIFKASQRSRWAC